MASLRGAFAISASPNRRQIAVSGLSELVRAFDVLEGKTNSEVRDALVKAGNPVRAAAEHYAVTEIRKMTGEWSKMRLGITTKSVYIAPEHRATRRGPKKRPKFGKALLGKAMYPAAEKHEHEVLDGLEKAIDYLSREEGF